MPFEKGNQLAKGYGRKGYEYEREHKEKMGRILSKDLEIVERIQIGKTKPKDKEKLAILKERVLKIMDKLHATKSEENIKAEIDTTIKLDDETRAIALELLKKRKQNE